MVCCGVMIFGLDGRKRRANACRLNLDPDFRFVATRAARHGSGFMMNSFSLPRSRRHLLSLSSFNFIILTPPANAARMPAPTSPSVVNSNDFLFKLPSARLTRPRGRAGTRLRSIGQQRRPDCRLQSCRCTSPPHRKTLLLPSLTGSRFRSMRLRLSGPVWALTCSDSA